MSKSLLIFFSCFFLFANVFLAPTLLAHEAKKDNKKHSLLHKESEYLKTETTMCERKEFIMSEEGAKKHLEHDHKAFSASHKHPAPHTHRVPHKHAEPHHPDLPKEAHQDHEPKHGGIFFMAANKHHHLEGVTTEECGFQLYLYDKYTQPINVLGFQAFIRVIMEKDNIEFFRFLTPTKDHMVLQSPKNLGLQEPYALELYLKFPETEVPELFNFDSFMQSNN